MFNGTQKTSDDDITDTHLLAEFPNQCDSRRFPRLNMAAGKKSIGCAAFLCEQQVALDAHDAPHDNVDFAQTRTPGFTW